MNKDHCVILDTHTWLWYVLGDDNLNKKHQALITDAAKHSSLYLSSISLWEVAMLEAKNRIVLSKDCHTWIKEAVTIPGLSLAPISIEIAVDSTRLPENFHGDPADRIIVATARQKNAILITKDAKIMEYAKAGHLRCVEA
ncbi:MAG: twitching motility protein PilT [Candidatus Raymondbacteria bacterium RifOxyA12_full_50_37]|uniref:Twitching motility protein PilT n=1 Tax=Candidatus Raymondbacteria bacterium RIFOXYD12_FULL_49_13 TaxID=1817890 RepID=A0A1F7F299_UNCRA|nr:MAG: twitching motility protein PilT [Candidatus Raymondbacteria bacterium RifOxyA12_full_50_37]OGJ85525.1 MAG: twitching motility protein PilT [Candidatus Raymondbacteria bacterium RIFOXYA2_FULL_49_16]OGJ95028.1 MAG: twitching motility protein PilT [Candidatus Raymondbacteria bacterium RIFOXYC2_FULL_50_21]OGK00692.1 MAG: twitching motility protein PilT [Candidatus Raymondbacteria bacterium RIFOXYD12_FULL_49_13]OGK02667.1 MAG: twitching motility protein PilT [Candidatus Raymondbacteria bacte